MMHIYNIYNVVYMHTSLPHQAGNAGLQCVQHRSIEAILTITCSATPTGPQKGPGGEMGIKSHGIH